MLDCYEEYGQCIMCTWNKENPFTFNDTDSSLFSAAH